MVFRSLKGSLYIILFAIVMQFIMVAIDLYLHQKNQTVEKHHLKFTQYEHNFLATLILEKDAERSISSKDKLLNMYQGLVLANSSNGLQLDSNLLGQRIQINNELFRLREEREQVHARLNSILPELAGSVSYIHDHHIAYLKNLVRHGDLQKDFTADEQFVRDDAHPASELDIISAAIEVQSSMLEIMEIFSGLQRGFSPKSVNESFDSAIDRFYKATNTFEDYSLDAQDGLLVEELLLNGVTFEESFNSFLNLELAIQSERKKLENNRWQFLDNISKVKQENEKNLAQFKRRMELNESISLGINFIMLLLLLYVARKIFKELKKVVRETSKIEVNHAYRIPQQTDDFKEFTHIFNALNRMGKAVSKKINELADSQALLEEQVTTRTSELSLANVQLKSEIDERVKNELQRRELEERLSRAEKMEAIGTLAGGVAHDLNNILSGIVSYPDLLLMNLPDDHKFRAPLLTIKESGEKAAVIVEDLLTMARRGVANQQSLDLNNLVQDFLDSPEFRTIEKHNPGVHIKGNLAATISSINGSRVHLLKSLMNLINNAAESIDGSGLVEVSTSNEYIDTVFKSYDQVNEGEYVKLRVADSGIGISEENLEKIFEPFYTTKAMGRSGSGLGMAVVWGTVKDHDGYIDVISEKGSGTTFDLYFPLQRKSIEPDMQEENLDGLLSTGERVLVVDDIRQQRDIASGMLEHLGYEVEAVDSGEQAIAYLQNNRVDLVLLDMIMRPGKDGLATYRDIIAINPRQKAIIVSGFSESEKVHEAQRLGAGMYVKKPYTIYEIAKAVRKELDG